MLGDTMRALLLEEHGYGVNIFEFINSEQTPKNIMLRAIKNRVKKQNQNIALTKYRQMVEMFNFAPALETLVNLPQNSTMTNNEE